MNNEKVIANTTLPKIANTDTGSVSVSAVLGGYPSPGFNG